jgi:spore coat polysaccharide biosynthesis protein SpsF
MIVGSRKNPLPSNIMPIVNAGIIQARMSSARFPGKMLYPVFGKPLLGYLLERVCRIKELNLIVVATSANGDDDQIAEFCESQGVACYRGPLDDVSKRFLDVIDHYRIDTFVRINGDSPLIAPEVIARGIKIFLTGDYDIVTNVFPRTFPKGQSVEMLSARVFTEGFKFLESADDHEHVTKYFYRNCDDYKIYNFRFDKDMSNVQMTIDYPEDIKLFSSIVSQMQKPHWQYGLEDILKFYHEAH